MSFLNEDTEYTVGYKSKYHDPNYKNLSLTLLFLVIALSIGIYASWVLSYIWLWFVVPLGVPAIGVAHAYGIMILKSFFLFKKEKKEDSTIAARGDTLLISFIAATVFLTSGWIVQYFFM